MSTREAHLLRQAVRFFVNYHSESNSEHNIPYIDQFELVEGQVHSLRHFLLVWRLALSALWTRRFVWIHTEKQDILVSCLEKVEVCGELSLCKN